MDKLDEIIALLKEINSKLPANIELLEKPAKMLKKRLPLHKDPAAIEAAVRDIILKNNQRIEKLKAKSNKK
ncbi:hypothetical protein [Mucilaginibacter sp. UR6-11]|uniref:hypothetical protein n=1 Tax=Mucilaginibacter sp. UR6-11 TaxID=1435644 RepID=UPI001E52DBC8|nr:hypothetical protein [Mucilaginibacter sp. UR6-11]MCC8426949.1 hypothetical protein [Mucilaginibacter sp. UR6-11]